MYWFKPRKSLAIGERTVSGRDSAQETQTPPALPGLRKTFFAKWSREVLPNVTQIRVLQSLALALRPDVQRNNTQTSPMRVRVGNPRIKGWFHIAGNRVSLDFMMIAVGPGAFAVSSSKAG